MESQPKNPEFRNNPENFHPCKYSAQERVSDSRRQHNASSEALTSDTRS